MYTSRGGYELIDDLPRHGACRVSESNSDLSCFEEDVHSLSKSHPDDLMIRVVLIGDSGVGKTCLGRRLYEDTFNAGEDSTIGAEYWLKKYRIFGTNCCLQIWDTSGEERYESITSQYYRGAKAVLICFDKTRRNTFTNVRYWADKAEKGSLPQTRVFLVGCKCDLVHTQVVKDREAGLEADRYHAEYFSTSAKESVNVNELFRSVASLTFADAVALSKKNDGEIPADYFRERRPSLSPAPQITRGGGGGGGCCGSNTPYH